MCTQGLRINNKTLINFNLMRDDHHDDDNDDDEDDDDDDDQTETI